MSQILIQNWQPVPAKNPDCTELVKEGKTSVTEYLETKVATVEYLLERINKKKQDPDVEPEDTLITSFCVLCNRNLVLPVDVPICKCEFVDDLKEELY